MAGTDNKQNLLAEGPSIILVEPQLGENIGMAARAMANFGLIDLRIVNPRDGWPSEKANSAASGALYVLEQATIYPTLREAMEDLNYVVATTARMRDGFKQVLGPQEASRNLRARFVKDQKVGILFGRERIGLRNDEVSLADDIVTFPVNPAYASLNIAQAVLLMSYEFLKTRDIEADNLPFAGPSFAEAPKEHLLGLFSQLEEALDARGYFRTPQKKPVLTENLRAVLTRPGFSEDEIQVLRGVISSLDRFTRKMPRGAGSPDDDAHRKAQKEAAKDG